MDWTVASSLIMINHSLITYGILQYEIDVTHLREEMVTRGIWPDFIDRVDTTLASFEDGVMYINFMRRQKAVDQTLLLL